MNRLLLFSFITFLGTFFSSAKSDKKYFTESTRPQFHYSPEENRMGSPTGLFFQDSIYHLFFECNRQSSLKRNNGMAHATSKDLIHWTHEGHIFEIDFKDEDTISNFDWSGSVVIDLINSSKLGVNGTPPVIAFFTGKNNCQYRAHGSLSGNWQIDPEPLAVGEGLCGSPKVFYHQGSSNWIMVLTQCNIATGNASKVFFYTSPDLKNWSLSATRTNLPECAALFCLTDEKNQEQWIYASANGKSILGNFDGKDFKPQIQNIALDYGKGFNGLCVIKREQKDILINGLKGGASPHIPFVGQLGFPTEIKLISKGENPVIVRTPIENLVSIRKKGLSKKEKNIIPGLKNNPVSSINGKELYFSSTIRLKTANKFSIFVRQGKKSPGIELLYEIQRQDQPLYQMFVKDSGVKIEPMEGEKIIIEFLLDRSSLEVFVNEGEYVFSYLTEEPDLGKDLLLINAGGEIFIENLFVDKILSIWDEHRN